MQGGGAQPCAAAFRGLPWGPRAFVTSRPPGVGGGGGGEPRAWGSDALDLRGCGQIARGSLPRPRTRLKEPSLSPGPAPRFQLRQTVQRLRSLPWEPGVSRPEPRPGCLLKPRDATCLHPLAGQWWGPFQTRVSVPELPSHFIPWQGLPPRARPPLPVTSLLGGGFAGLSAQQPVLWVQAWEGVRGCPGR